MMFGHRRYLVAPDKYKGTLTAVEAARAIAGGVRRADPDAVVIELPFADGGEGTVDAVVVGGGERRTSRVRGPLGVPVDVNWAIRDGIAFIEMAEPSGLRLVPHPDSWSALAADTWGTGELIREALDAGVGKVVIGVGGSATTDGAAGALRALGFRFLDRDGAEVDPADDGHGLAVRIDSSMADPRLTHTRFEVCADVLSPMVGEQGAARTFGPQKGADPDAVETLERRLATLAGLYADAASESGVIYAAGGAGGGFSAGAMALLGARIRSGVDAVAEILSLDDHLALVDVVIVGEGSMDEQSRLGKTPIGIARRARDEGLPVIAVPGTSPFTGEDLIDDGIAVISTAVEAARATDGDALADAATHLGQATEAGVAEYLAMLGRRSVPMAEG